MVDAAHCIADLWYRLGFLSQADIDASGTWVTSVELYQWADEAAKLIAYKSGVFLTFDASIAATSGTAVYELPATHVFTMAAWFGTTQLRLTPVRELWALDGTWPTTSGAPNRCSMDAGSVGTITLYPNPAAGGTVSQVCNEYPATIASASSTVALPTVLQDYLSYAMMAGARGKESDAAMPEMADHFAERCGLYEQIIEHLYGTGQ
jgi:hypothetical protein